MEVAVSVGGCGAVVFVGAEAVIAEKVTATTVCTSSADAVGGAGVQAVRCIAKVMQPIAFNNSFQVFMAGELVFD